MFLPFFPFLSLKKNKNDNNKTYSSLRVKKKKKLIGEELRNLKMINFVFYGKELMIIACNWCVVKQKEKTALIF